MAKGKAFPARFAGRCCKCGQSIRRGDWVRWSRSGVKRIWHDGCDALPDNPDYLPTPVTPPEPAPVVAPESEVRPMSDSVVLPGATAAGDALAVLVAPSLLPMLQERIEGLFGEVSDSLMAECLRAVADRLPQRELVIHSYQAPSITVGAAHDCLPAIIDLMALRQHVYLYGPAGAGKSHIAHQAAKVLGLPYRYESLQPMSTPSLLWGYMSATGVYVPGSLYEVYRNGGVLCLDELDNASSAMLTALNAALANGCCAFPCGMVDRHADFILVCTGNTIGQGPTDDHRDRRAIDSATRDRLAFEPVGYDERLEREIALGINPASGPWITWVQAARSYISDVSHGVLGVKSTPRASYEGAKMLGDLSRSRHDMAAIANRLVFKGVVGDSITRLLSAVPLPRVWRPTVEPVREVPAQGVLVPEVA